jgi:hypothetical protein
MRVERLCYRFFRIEWLRFMFRSKNGTILFFVWLQEDDWSHNMYH